jgi:hypothetical protein
MRFKNIQFSKPDASRFDFRASRPGHIFEIKTDLDRGQATVEVREQAPCAPVPPPVLEVWLAGLWLGFVW